MNDIAAALLNRGFFSTHTQALVFAARVTANRPLPRSLSKFSLANFVTGVFLVVGGAVNVAISALVILFAPRIKIYFLIYFLFSLAALLVGVLLMFQEILLRVGLLRRRITDIELLWKSVSPPGGGPLAPTGGGSD